MLTKLFLEEDENEHPVQALCPWLNFVRPGLILDKDGSLLAGFEFSALDPDAISDDSIDHATQLHERAINQFDERITAWTIVHKRRDPSYDPMDSNNDTSNALDAEYSKAFTSGQRYETRYLLFLLYTPSQGADKVFDRVARLRSEGKSLSASLLGAVKEALSGSAAQARDTSKYAEHIIAFSRVIDNFKMASSMRLTQLEGDDFTDQLSCLLNPAREPMPRRKPLASMIDAWLPTDYYSTGKDVIKFRNNKNVVYAAAIGMKQWPDATSPMLFESLLKLEVEMTICQIIRFLGPLKSRGEINKAMEYYKLTQHGFLSHIIASAGGAKPEASAGKASLLEEAKLALDLLEGEGINQTYHNTTVIVYGRSLGELEANVTHASKKLTFHNFTLVRELKNTMPSFVAMLPGQWSQQSRYDLLCVQNVANCAPLYTMLPGDKHHPHYSEDIFNQEVPALAVFGNGYGGRSYFSSHVGQVGHMLIIMPTGGGKTTFINFLLSQFQRYKHCNTFIFDRNDSCKITTLLHGGSHIDLKASTAKFNPFFAMMDGSPDGKNWVREWIIRRMVEGGYTPDAQDRKVIDDTLSRMAETFEQHGEPLRMQDFCTYLNSKRLTDQMEEWIEGGPYSMFDNAVDSFSLSSWTTIEMREIMQVDRLARAFIDYAFRKIYAALDGRPTIIYLEEASFLINDPRFSSMLDDWLKTFRKKFASVWMTIQSPESVTDSAISATLRDNVPSYLLGINQKVEAQRESYIKNFGLEEHQVDQIAGLVKNRDYLLVQGPKSRVFQSQFPSSCLAYIRSEPSALNAFEQHRASGLPDWKQRYIAEMTKT